MEGGGEDPKVVSFLREEADRPLLAQCARELEAPAISVVPLGRVGYSGSRLYAAWGTEDGRGLANVIKINERADIDDECAALKSMYTFFADARDFLEVDNGSCRSAIIYRLIPRDEGPGVEGLNIEELKDVAFEEIGDDAADELLVTLIDNLYLRCCANAHKGRRETVSLADQYQRYRRDDHADEQMQVLFGEPPRTDRFEFLEADILDPRSVRDAIEGTEMEVTLASAVHGDLHPNNVLIDSDGMPRLIDFAWGRRDTHVLKDFVLLECSLRFLMFPKRPPHLPTQLQMDTALLDETGPDVLLELGSAYPLYDRYRRLGAMLKVIRANARRVCDDGYDFSEYLAAQFCVLYGLLSYPDYHAYVASRALGLIAAQLEPGGA